MNHSFNTPEQQAKLDAINNKLTETMIAALKAAHNAVTADPSNLDSLARQRRGEEIRQLVAVELCQEPIPKEKGCAT